VNAGSVDLKDRASYRHWTHVTIRFSDEDRMGHVNNAAYSVWIEAARVAYLESLYRSGTELDTVLARIIVDYLHETRWPGDVRIGSRLLAVGSKSLRTAYGVFRDDRCLATSECVNVFFDPRTRTSTLPPAPVREALLGELAGLQA
jgi:acyl-CoA thioester hydrolase